MQFFWNRIFVILSLAFVSNFLFSQEKQKTFNPNYTIINNLDDEWQVFDEKYDGYVPYIEARHQNPKIISFWLDLEKYKTYDLLFFSPESKTYLFINNGLSKELKTNTWISLKIDSLAKKYKDNKIFCTFYSPLSSLPPKNLYIGQNKNLALISKAGIKQKEDWFELKSKELVYKIDFVVTIFFLILLLYAFFYKYYPKELLEYFSLNYARFRNDELGAVLKPFMTIYLLIIMGHVLVVTFFYIFAQKNFANILYTNLSFLYTGQSLGVTMLNFVILFLIVIAIFITKYILLWLASNILNLESIINIHFYEYFRLSYLFYSFFVLILVICFLAFNVFFPYLASFSLYILVIFHITQTLITSFIITQKVEFKNLYLFYYLCITELTPILIGVKLLLFS